MFRLNYVFFFFIHLFFLVSIPGTGQDSDIKQDTLLARQYLDQVQQFRRQHMPDSAIYYLKRAGDLYSSHQLWDLYLPLAAETGYWYLEMAEIDSARIQFQKGQRLLDQALSRDTLAIIDFLGYKGYLYFIVQELDSGVLNTLKNLELTRRYYKGEKNEALVSAYNRLASSYFNLNDFDLALDYYDSALQVLDHLDKLNGQTAANIYYNIGDLYQFIADFDKAVEFDQMSLKILQEILEPDHYFILDTYLSLAYCFASRNESRQDNLTALEYLQKIDELTGGEFPDPAFGLHMLTSKGLANRHLGNFELAIDYFLQAIDLITANFGPDHPDLGNMYQNLGNTYAEKGDFKRSEVHFEKAVKLYREKFGDQFREVSMTMQMLADVYRQQGLYETALQKSHQALASLLPDQDLADVLDVPVSEEVYLQPVLLSALRSKADLLYTNFQQVQPDQDVLKSAVDTYQVLLSSLQEYKKKLVHQENKLQKAEAFHEVYARALQAVTDLYQKAPDNSLLIQALHTVESEKASVLVSDLQELKGKAFSGIPDSLLQKETMLKLSIRFTEQQLYEEELAPKPEGTKALRDKLFQLRRDFESLTKYLEHQFPRYFQYKYNADSFKLAEVQEQLLGDGKVIMEYVLTGEKGFLFLIAKDKLEMLQLEVDSTLRKEIMALPKLAQSGSPADFSHASHLLYQKMMAPALVRIKEWHQPIDHLLIVPDGITGYLPFEILVTKESPGQQRYKELHYLVRDYQISYHYSIRLLDMIRPVQENRSYHGAVLAVAPTFGKNSNPLLATRSVSDRQISEQLESLPQAQAEVNFIAELLEGKVLSGEVATESNFKMEAANYPVIHLASHTLINDEQPMYSRLLFSQKDSLEDGLLHTYELYNLQLKADLVCLSACNTGIGKVYQGEGIISLGRGFFYAGVPNIMMSLWNVPDFSTASLMEHFYQELKDGKTYVEAMREAKLKYLENADENTANPYFWSAFIMVGSPGNKLPDEISSSFQGWIFASAGILLLLVIASIFYRKRILPVS